MTYLFRSRPACLILFLLFIGGPSIGQVAPNDTKATSRESIYSFQTIDLAAENQSIRLHITMPAEIKLDDHLDIGIEIVNGRDEYIKLPHSHGDLDLSMTIHDEMRNANVALTRKGTEAAFDAMPHMGSMYSVSKLQSKQKIETKYNLRDYFEINQHGVYTISLWLPILGTASTPRSGDELDIRLCNARFSVVEK